MPIDMFAEEALRPTEAFDSSLTVRRYLDTRRSITKMTSEEVQYGVVPEGSEYFTTEEALICTDPIGSYTQPS